MNDFRIEKDSLGEVKCPKNHYWGAQTQRAIINFPIGSEKFPKEFIKALAIVKRACTEVNMDLGLLEPKTAELIIKASQEIIDGKLDNEFPLVIWQTGSGTQTNMNINEVIANRAIELAGGELGSKTIHPNDHVNRSQSSNDVIPTAMHLSAVVRIHEHLLPALEHLLTSLKQKEEEFEDIIKTGRTHLQDATPVTLGQEFSGYVTQIKKGVERVNKSLPNLYELAIGGTAVGTGLNSHPEFSKKVVEKIAKLTGYNFVSAKNKFEGIAAHDAILEISGALKTIAASLMKIANDIRWMASGPRNGLGELILPANEPGSSIMPGKINPTQVEAVTQVVAQIFGNDVTIAFAASQGNFELNVFKPVMIYNLLQSIQLLGDVSRSFADRCIQGLKANVPKIQKQLENNLMLVTRLTPLVGYDLAAEIAHEALAKNKTLKQVILERKLFTEDEIDRILDPSEMLQP
ncbi:MAG: class II fumarate hydratase [Candidatus Hodarchaeales archaeon]